MTIGERIKSIRTSKKMTQREVAEKCGFADSAIRKYESGRIAPKWMTLVKIANALEIDPFTLMGIGSGISGVMNVAKENNNDMIVETARSMAELAKKENIESVGMYTKVIPTEYDDLSIIIGKMGYYITVDDGRYYLVKDDEKKEITVEELQNLVRSSRAAVNDLLDDLMNRE